MYTYIMCVSVCVCVCVCEREYSKTGKIMPVISKKRLSISVGGKLLLKVMHYNIALLPKKVTNYVT